MSSDIAAEGVDAHEEPILALGPRSTVEELVALKLREAIIAGALKPGDRLAYRPLARRFGVSVTPVRIALRELSNEGLVELRPHTGARVTPLSGDELEEIFATRIGVEGWLARHGATRLNGEAIETMRQDWQALRRAEESKDTRSYLEHSLALRATCYEAAAKPRLYDRFQVLYEHSRRYMFLLVADPSRLEQSRRNMESFLEACLERNGDAAQLAIQHALQTTLSFLSDAFDSAISN